MKLRNVGPSIRADLKLIGITTVAQVSISDPDHLYLELQRVTGTRQDPCVWDVFAAAIHQAKTGEAMDWWKFTPVRKARQANGAFPAVVVQAGSLRPIGNRPVGQVPDLPPA
jgi:hypothetical protein